LGKEEEEKMIKLKELLNLRNMVYTESIRPKDKKRMARKLEIFDENIVLPRKLPPENDSSLTLKEIKYLASIEPNPEFVESNDDVVEVDGKPSRIVRVGMWSTTFFTYDVRDGIIVGGSKLVVQNDKLKDLKIEKPLPNLDLSKYKVDTTCQDLLTELVKSQKGKK